MAIYGTDYYGFVYIWMDVQNTRFYIGSHYGSVDDGYICSNRWMKAAYTKRPHTFKRRVLFWLSQPDLKQLQQKESEWLQLIKPHQLSTSKNVMAGTARYYNMKQTAVGGNGSANKGKQYARQDSHAFTWLVTDPQGTEFVVDRLYNFCRDRGLNTGSLHHIYTSGKTTTKGRHAGWRMILLLSSPSEAPGALRC